MNVPSFDPIEKEGVAEKVVRKITDMLKAGNLKPGDRLPSERELVKLFQVSRPSLREALRALSILGVLEIQHGGGIYISDLDAKTLLAPLDFYIRIEEGSTEDLFECRHTIDVAIVKKAAELISDEDLEKLESLLQNQWQQQDDPVGFRISDYEFHGIIFKASGNHMMERIATGLHHIGIENRRRATEIPGLIAQSCKDHEEILAALQKRDKKAAVLAVKNHINNIERSTLQAIELLQQERET